MYYRLCYCVHYYIMVHACVPVRGNYCAMLCILIRLSMYMYMYVQIQVKYVYLNNYSTQLHVHVHVHACVHILSVL